MKANNTAVYAEGSRNNFKGGVITKVINEYSSIWKALTLLLSYGKLLIEELGFLEKTDGYILSYQWSILSLLPKSVHMFAPITSERIFY